MSKRNASALIGVTLRAMFRRRGICLLLIAVAAMGACGAVVLENLAARQEFALADTIENTVIQCTVTDARGTDSGNIRMGYLFLNMLEGKYNEENCNLVDFVTNVRAKAMSELEIPQGARLRRILSVDSDPSLSATEGAAVKFFDGYSEELLKGTEQVCLVPPEMVTEDGFITVADGFERASLCIIGTVSGGPDNTIYCPFYMPWEVGHTYSLYADSCSFDILDNQKLDESKAEIYRWFVEPKLTNQLDGKTYGVIVDDETYQATLSEIRDNLSMLRLLQPMLIVICALVGFFAGNLATRGRIKEFAVMRCIGMKRGLVFWLVFSELALLALSGALIGTLAGILVEGAINSAALLKAAFITGAFILGSAVAAYKITGVNAMKLMKVED